MKKRRINEPGVFSDLQDRHIGSLEKAGSAIETTAINKLSRR